MSAGAVRVSIRFSADRNGLPASGKYSTLAKFAGDEDASEAWSIVLRFDPDAVREGDTILGTAEFLNPGPAPSDRLVSGATFSLWEGRRKTVDVVVL